MYFLLTENCPFLHSCVLVWIRNPWPVNRQVLFLPILLLIIDIDLAVMALHHGLVISIMLSMAILPHCKLVATKPGPTTCSCPDHLPIVGTGRSSRHFLPDNILDPFTVEIISPVLNRAVVCRCWTNNHDATAMWPAKRKFNDTMQCNDGEWRIKQLLCQFEDVSNT